LWSQCWSDVWCYWCWSIYSCTSFCHMIDDWLDGWLIDWLTDWFVAGWWVQAEIDVHKACCASCVNAFPPRRSMVLSVFNLFVWKVHVFWIDGNYNFLQCQFNHYSPSV
jgi:hypothetical protein